MIIGGLISRLIFAVVIKLTSIAVDETVRIKVRQHYNKKYAKKQ